MQFICLTLDGIKRWVRIDQIAAMEEEGDGTILYLVNNSSVHIACDQGIDDIMTMISDAEDDDEELSVVN